VKQSKESIVKLFVLPDFPTVPQKCTRKSSIRFSAISMYFVSLYVVYSVFSPFSSATLSSFLTSSFVVFVATTTTTHDGIGIAALHQAHHIL
jgi:hypothetical protein